MLLFEESVEKTEQQWFTLNFKTAISILVAEPDGLFCNTLEDWKTVRPLIENNIVLLRQQTRLF